MNRCHGRRTKPEASIPPPVPLGERCAQIIEPVKGTRDQSMLTLGFFEGARHAFACFLHSNEAAGDAIVEFEVFFDELKKSQEKVNS